MKMNTDYRQLEESYLFSTVARKVADYQAKHPEAAILRLGIGDVTRPVASAVIRAMTAAVEEEGRSESFRGYGPEQGYVFLREAVQAYYQRFDVTLPIEDIFISDGAKSDLGNILDLFDRDNTVLIPDPVYPVYRDTNQMAGRRIVYLEANRENGFLPMPVPGQRADLIYLCSPNNPTGAVYSREQLAAWVAYAREQEAIILFDAAYESFVQDPALPRSIFEIEGAADCAIEFCSLSKTAGFTGLRCGYTVVPGTLQRAGMSLRAMWLRRQTTKFNGVSYPVQRAAAAALTGDGLAEGRENRRVYQQNAAVIAETMGELGLFYTGGLHSPYIWLECPDGMGSWEFFDDLLERAQVVGTPGCGFGKNGEGFFRLTAFGTPEDTRQAMTRMRTLYAK